MEPPRIMKCTAWGLCIPGVNPCANIAVLINIFAIVIFNYFLLFLMLKCFFSGSWKTLAVVDLAAAHLLTEAALYRQFMKRILNAIKNPEQCTALQVNAVIYCIIRLIIVIISAILYNVIY